MTEEGSACDVHSSATFLSAKALAYPPLGASNLCRTGEARDISDLSESLTRLCPTMAGSWAQTATICFIPG